MKILKTSIVTMLFVLVGLSSVVASAQANSDSFEADVEKYNALDITAIDMETTGITPETAVSREEFAKVAARILDSNYEAVVPYESGTDLSERDKGMLYLRSIGIVAGDGNGVYEPDRNITTAEAAKILGCIAGYSFGFDADIAAKQGLLKGVGIYGNSEINYAQFITMLDNLMEMDMFIMVNSSGTYRKTDVTVLENYKGILRKTGILEAHDDSSIYSYDGPGKGKAMILNEIFAVGEIDCESYIGQQVEFYYTMDKDQLVLKYLTPIKNTVKILSHKNEPLFDAGAYTYIDDDGRTKTLRIKSEIIYMYNGKKADTIDDFTPDCGTIILIDNNSDGTYDILHIVDKKLVVVSSKIDNELKVIDEFDAEFNLELSDCERYKIYDKDGIELEFADIIPGDVLEVEKSQGTFPTIRITVIREEIAGTIEEINDSTGCGKVAISGTFYKRSERFNQLVKAGELANEFALGKECKAFLNSYGEIVYLASANVDELRTGYVIRFAEKGGIQREARMQLLDQSGSLEILTFAKRVRTDNGILKGENIGAETFPNKCLVRFKTDIHGAISELYYPSKDSETFKIVCDGSWYFRRSAFGRFFAKKYGEDNFVLGCTLDNNAKIFYIGGDNPENYSVLSATQLTTASNYDVVGCSTKGLSGIADVVLINAEGEFGFLNQSGRKAAVINGVCEVMGEDGVVRMAVEVLMDGISQTIEIEDERQTTAGSSLPFGVGDVISFARVNNRILLDDEASAYCIMADYTDTGLVVPKTGYKYSQTSYTTDGILKYGPVYDVKGQLIFINPIDIANEDTIDAIDTSAATVRVYIYDEKREKFHEGDVSEAKGYKKNPGDYSTAYTMANFEWGVVVIYP